MTKREIPKAKDNELIVDLPKPKILQKPLACRNAHCGAMCCRMQIKEMQTLSGGEPTKCYYYERRDDLYNERLRGKFDGHGLVIDKEKSDNYCSNCGAKMDL